MLSPTETQVSHRNIKSSSWEVKKSLSMKVLFARDLTLIEAIRRVSSSLAAGPVRFNRRRLEWMSDNPVVSVRSHMELNEGASLLNPSSFPASVLSQFAGGDAR